MKLLNVLNNLHHIAKRACNIAAAGSKKQVVAPL
jgi:hypothetical protein